MRVPVHVFPGVGAATDAAHGAAHLILDYLNPSTPDGFDCHVCVVGAGPAGIAIAAAACAQQHDQHGDGKYGDAQTEVPGGRPKPRR